MLSLIEQASPVEDLGVPLMLPGTARNTDGASIIRLLEKSGDFHPTDR